MGRNTAALGQKTAGAVHLFGDVGPNIRRERPQLLNARPARGDRLQGRTGQWALAAVIEIGFIGQRRH